MTDNSCKKERKEFVHKLISNLLAPVFRLNRRGEKPLHKKFNNATGLSKNHV